MATEYAHWRFTVDEYHKMGAAGILGEDDRVELVDGKIVQMSPINISHAVCVDRLNKLLNRILPEEFTMRVQSPIFLDDINEPQPDVAVLRPGDYLNMAQHPGPADILLIIEVADSTVSSDRRQKMPRYARAGIPEAWIVNIPKGVVEVYSNPVDGKYESMQRVGRSGSITVETLPDISLRVDDFLGNLK